MDLKTFKLSIVLIFILSSIDVFANGLCEEAFILKGLDVLKTETLSLRSKRKVQKPSETGKKQILITTKSSGSRTVRTRLDKNETSSNEGLKMSGQEAKPQSETSVLTIRPEETNFGNSKPVSKKNIELKSEEIVVDKDSFKGKSIYALDKKDLETKLEYEISLLAYLGKDEHEYIDSFERKIGEFSDYAQKIKNQSKKRSSDGLTSIRRSKELRKLLVNKIIASGYINKSSRLNYYLAESYRALNYRDSAVSAYKQALILMELETSDSMINLKFESKMSKISVRIRLIGFRLFQIKISKERKENAEEIETDVLSLLSINQIQINDLLEIINNSEISVTTEQIQKIESIQIQNQVKIIRHEFEFNNSSGSKLINKIDSVLGLMKRNRMERSKSEYFYSMLLIKSQIYYEMGQLPNALNIINAINIEQLYPHEKNKLHELTEAIESEF